MSSPLAPAGSCPVSRSARNKELSRGVSPGEAGPDGLKQQYGTLAGRYVREFEARSLRAGASAAEPFVGSADIQSLADPANRCEGVRTMRLARITKQAVIGLVAATLLPMAPLLLTVMPLEELLKKLASILF